jgi:hypothetical protein
MNRAQELERLEKELEFITELNAVIQARLATCKEDVNNLIGEDE